MKCKKVKDQLLTGYLDKELGADERSEIHDHLAVCADCRELLDAVRKTAVVPFTEVKTMQPDSVVWQRIREEIEAERARSKGGFWKLVDILVSRFPLPVPLMRAAFATVLILGVVVLARWPSSYADPVYGYISEQMTFMNELRAGNTDFLNGDLKDYDAIFSEVNGSRNF